MERTDRYWDCDCREDYIREDTEYQCPTCGALQDEKPFSLVEDVLPRLKEELAILEALVKIDCFSVADLRRRDYLEETLSVMYAVLGG